MTVENSENSENGKHYAAAHAAHYVAKDLREALQLYRGIIAEHPDSQEAGYSRSQIQNIVNAVVPKEELLDARIEQVLARFDDDQQEAAVEDRTSSAVP